MNYRNPKLRALAKDMPCVLCHRQDGTTVWAHSNDSRHGKGTGLKAHDVFGAALCFECHTALDSGAGLRATKRDIFQEAMEKTWLYLWREGLVQVA